ncbi:penicillin-binding protein 1A [Desulfovibrionales bacterium]
MVFSVVLATLIFGLGLAVYLWASRDLPGFRKVTDFRPPLVTTVYARDGCILGYLYREKRFLTSLSELPEYLPRAFLAAEDSDFYSHEGIDFTAILRATIKNLRSFGLKQGGSTITQQIVKRLLLSSEKSFERKIKEVILSYRLENYLTKDEILTIYLNQIYMGVKSYGVEAAARSCFGKHASQLDLAEAAVLAGLPQAPSRYDPYRDPEATKVRQKYVLGRMRELGWITADQYDQAVVEPLYYRSMDDISWKQGAWYLDEVRRWMIDFLSEDNQEKYGFDLGRYGEDAVMESGLHVWTAVDMAHQAAAEKAVQVGLEDYSKRRGWQGAIQCLAPADWCAFLAQGRVSVDLLAPGTWVKALVVNVTRYGAQVKVGDRDAFIPVESMRWARPINVKLAAEQVAAVTDATRVVAVGDVVWASVFKPSHIGWENEAEKRLAKIKDLSHVLLLGLEQRPEIQGALVSIEPLTGEIRALVGGYAYEFSQFNRATQAMRQPGSAFKPIVYSAAIDAGFTPASVVIDAPAIFSLEGGRTWSPQNFEKKFFGPTLLATALAKSRNLVTIRVAERIGIKRVIDRAKALGITSPFPFNLSVCLGTVATTPINLCQAYTAFARGGTIIKPRLVLGMKMAWGETLPVPGPEVTEAVSPQNAYIITSMLKEVVNRGTGWRAKELNRPVAGKTGTTNSEQDAWFMGYTPYLLTGVYVGFDQAQPMGRLETGARAACPVWLKYRKAVEGAYPIQDFVQPPGISFVNFKIAGGDSYFLPFKSGTEPYAVKAPVKDGQGDDSESGTDEDLFKQMF